MSKLKFNIFKSGDESDYNSIINIINIIFDKEPSKAYQAPLGVLSAYSRKKNSKILTTTRAR